MRRWLAVSTLCVLVCGPLLSGCGLTEKKPPPIVVPVPTIESPASSTPEPPPSTTEPTPVPTAEPTRTTPAPPPPLAGGGTADVKATRSGTGHLGAVRLARQYGYDRLVLEFNDRVPGYTVGYRPLPAHADGSGAEIPLPGATAMLQVSMTPASGHQDGTATPTYPGPATVSANTAQVTQAKAAGDFESVLNWVVGVRKKTPFKVSVLADPPRLVVDFQQ